MSLNCDIHLAIVVEKRNTLEDGRCLVEVQPCWKGSCTGLPCLRERRMGKVEKEEKGENEKKRDDEQCLHLGVKHDSTELVKLSKSWLEYT